MMHALPSIRRDEIGNEDTLTANRSLLLQLAPAVVVGLISDAFAMTQATALTITAIFTLIILRFFTRSTSYSLATVFVKRYISWPIVLGSLVLTMIGSQGAASFFKSFAPTLYSAVPDFAITSNLDVVISYMAVGILLPFCEEFVFRYLALNSYAKARSKFFALIFVSSLFALAHGSIAHTLSILPFSIIVTLVMIKTQEFWTVFAIHSLYNSLSITLAISDLYHGLSDIIPGIVGFALVLLSILISIWWLGLPKKEPYSTTRNLWSGSLVFYILISAVSIVITTVSVF
ncbi:MAG: lysostaphin resistance A-like protein [Trueperaceae bacterium]